MCKILILIAFLQCTQKDISLQSLAPDILKINSIYCDSNFYHYNQGSYEASKTLRVIHCADNNKRFLETIHGKEAFYLPLLDPSYNTIWVNKEREIFLYNFNRIGIYHTNPSQSEFSNLVYGNCIGWRPPGELFISETMDQIPPSIFDIKNNIASEYSLTIVQEAGTVKNMYKSSNKNKTDTLIFDPDFNFALVERTIVRGNFTYIYKNSNFKLIGKKFWLPVKCTRDIFKNKILTENFSLDVNELRVNTDVDPAIFEPKLPHGSLIFTDKTKLLFSIQGGKETLDSWAGYLAFIKNRDNHSFYDIAIYSCLVLLAFYLILKCSSIFFSLFNSLFFNRHDINTKTNWS